MFPAAPVTVTVTGLAEDRVAASVRVMAPSLQDRDLTGRGGGAPQDLSLTRCEDQSRTQVSVFRKV